MAVIVQMPSRHGDQVQQALKSIGDLENDIRNGEAVEVVLIVRKRDKSVKRRRFDLEFGLDD